jgi:hypothetical protein
MKTSIAKTSPHMYTNENHELHIRLWFIPIFVAQPSDQLIIYVDTQSCRPSD